MKYRICTQNGTYWQKFDTFNAAWDFIEKYVPKLLQHEIYIVGEL